MTDASFTSCGPLCCSSYTDTSLILRLRPKRTRQADHRVSYISRQSAVFPTRPHHTRGARRLCVCRQSSTRESEAGRGGALSPQTHSNKVTLTPYQRVPEKARNHEPRRQPEAELGSSRQPCGYEFTAQSSRNPDSGGFHPDNGPVSGTTCHSRQSGSLDRTSGHNKEGCFKCGGRGESKDAGEYLVFLKVKGHQLGPTFPQVLKCSMLVCTEYKVHIKPL